MGMAGDRVQRQYLRVFLHKGPDSSLLFSHMKARPISLASCNILFSVSELDLNCCHMNGRVDEMGKGKAAHERQSPTGGVGPISSAGNSLQFEWGFMRMLVDP